MEYGHVVLGAERAAVICAPLRYGASKQMDLVRYERVRTSLGVWRFAASGIFKFNLIQYLIMSLGAIRR